MAENKQEKRTFKYGDREYLLDDLLKLHGEQENNYYDFARNRGQYDDTALQGLRAAITSRIGAVKNGQSFDGDGVMEGDVVDNTSIKTQKKGLFKKDKYVDQDNTEWAKYYLNKLVGQLKPYEKEAAKKSGWDMTKHGLAAYLTGQGLNAQEIFEGKDLRDKNNPDAARAFTQRDELLRAHLGGYKNWLAGKGFDFTKNDNEWDDDFVTTLDSVINNKDWNDRISLAASLRKLGAGNEYATAFTSDKWDLSKSQDQLDAEAKKRKEEEDAKKKKGYMDEFEEFAYNNKRESNPIYNKPFDYSNFNFRGKDASFDNWYGDLNAEERKQYGTYLGRDNDAWLKAWGNFTNSLKGGTAYNDKNVGILLQGTLESNPNAFVDLGDGNYLIKDSITDSGQGTVYNRKNGYTDTVFLGDLAGNSDEIKNMYKQLAYKYINNKYGTKYEDRPDVFKDGGELIPKNQYGSKVVYNWETTDESIRPKAEKNGVKVETQKAKDKYIDSDNQSEDNPNAGWGAKESARLGYAIADLGSAVAAFVPGVGTAASAVLGLGSTFGNFFTDMGDDAITAGEMWKNFGMNLGMDALGLIPGGGAASKMGKIIKGVKTIVPAIIALPGVTSMLANSPEIAQSWKKAFDGDPESGGSKMTYQDYMNILQVLNVAAGTTNMARNAYKSAKVSPKQADKIAVDVTEKLANGQQGQRKALVLEGDDATNFRKAQAEGKAQEFLDNIEGGHQYTINETTKFNRGKFWGKGNDDKFELFHQNPLGTTGTGKANTFDVKFDTRKGKLYADTGWRGGADLSDADLINMSSRQKLSDFQSKQQGRIDNYIKGLRETAQAYGAKTKKHKEHLKSTNDKITATESDINAKNNQYTAQEGIRDTQNQIASNIEAQRLGTGRKDAIIAIRQARADIQRLETEKVAIKGKGKAKKQQAKQDEIDQLKSRIIAHQKYLSDNSKGNLARAKQAATAAESKMTSLQAETAKLQSLLTRLNTHKGNLETRVNTHSRAFDRLVKFKPMVRQFNGKDYTFGTKFTEADLINQGLFKQGGSINRNKINKFLNYAKG